MKKFECLEKYMLSLGFKKNDIKKILDNNVVRKYSSDNLLNNINDLFYYLTKFGYNKTQIINMIKKLPNICTLGINNIIEKFNLLLEIGYNKEQIIKITVKQSHILAYSIDNMKKKINDLKKIGYRNDQIIKITTNLPSIYGLSINNIGKKINDLIEIGYKKNDIIIMSLILPSIYSYSIENIKQKINDLMSLGYTKEEVIQMTIKFPALFGSTFGNIKEKVGFYKEKNMDFWIVKNTKYLMQSIELTYARYCFLLDIGIEINKNNYTKLFVCQSDFKKQYKITTSEILEKYNYDEYKTNKGLKNETI